MFSSIAYKGGLLDSGRNPRRVVRDLNRTAKRHRKKWHATPDPVLMFEKERRFMAHEMNREAQR